MSGNGTEILTFLKEYDKFCSPISGSGNDFSILLIFSSTYIGVSRNLCTWSHWSVYKSKSALFCYYPGNVCEFNNLTQYSQILNLRSYAGFKIYNQRLQKMRKLGNFENSKYVLDGFFRTSFKNNSFNISFLMIFINQSPTKYDQTRLKITLKSGASTSSE